MNKKFPIKVCPTCGSVNFKSVDGRATSPFYKCLTCGYYGIFPETYFDSEESLKQYIEEQDKKIDLAIKKYKSQKN